jgi:hypothetical protein
MAKRKRLTPAQPSYLAGETAEKSGLSPSLGAAPIAQVASEAATQSALQELSDTMETARSKGLLLQEMPISAVDASYLVRDRVTHDADEMATLMASIKARGQQTPIDVTYLGENTAGPQYGLISGWRRLAALRALFDAGEGDQFGKVKARIVAPEGAQDAYLAMVEENEIRVNLSHYERARIVVKALQEGIYDSQKEALNGLFGNVARAKRSKIGSFMRLVDGLDDALFFPGAISEKLGLALVKEITQSAAFLDELKTNLMLTDRPVAQAELDVLQAALQQAEVARHTPNPPAPSAPKPPAMDTTKIVRTVGAGLTLSYQPDKGRLEISGERVSDELANELQAWLELRGE